MMWALRPLVCTAALLVTVTGGPASSSSGLQGALQNFLDEKLAGIQKKSRATALQLSWKSASEEFTVATGSVVSKAGTRPLAVNDTFLFGSGAKTFTAVLIARRWEEGRLDLNATVAHYVDDLFKAKLGKTFLELFGPNATEMTVWHLLTMQSGIPDFDVPEFDAKMLHTAGTRVWTPLDIVVYASTQPWVCLPGGCVFYSSTNYIMLGYVLLALEDKPVDAWATYDQREVLPTDKVAGLSFVNEGPVSQVLSTPGHTATGGGMEIEDTPAGILGWTCGNLAGTSRGFAAWMWELLARRTLLSPRGLALLEQTRMISKGWGKPWLTYGGGLFIQQVDFFKEPPVYGEWGTTLGHGGDTYGFVSDQGFVPQLNATWSWVANSDSGVTNFDITCNMLNTVAKALGRSDPQLHCLSLREAVDSRGRWHETMHPVLLV